MSTVCCGKNRPPKVSMLKRIRMGSRVTKMALKMEPRTEPSPPM